MDYSMYLTQNEDGTQSFDKAGFEKAMQSEIDSAVSKGVDSFKKSYEQKLAQEKMSEQERFEAEKKEFEAYKISAKKEIITAKAKAKLEGKEFSKAEIDTLLGFVTDDEEASLKVIDTMVSEREKLIEENNKKFLEELQKKQPTPKTDANADENGKTAEPVKRKSAEDIKKRFNK